MLFEARRLAHPALERHGAVMSEDLCVPRSRLPELLQTVQDVGAQHELTIATIAHAGDGNVHPLLVTPHGDEAAQARAKLAFEDLVDAAVDLGGTVTGEHGVGTLKMRGMQRELDPSNLAMMQAIKATLDPRDLFNPGKVLPRAAAD